MTEKKKKNTFLTPIIRKLILVLCLVAFFGVAGYFTVQYVREYMQNKKYQARSAMVERELVHCAELCTLKENYADIVSIKKQAMLGLARSYSIVRYKAVIRAGIRNFTDIAVTISPDGESVVVVVPSCEILSNDVTSFSVFDDSQNVFTPIQTQEVLSEIEKAREAAGEEFLQQGFLSEANGHARSVFESFFSAMGFKNVTVRVTQ